MEMQQLLDGHFVPVGAHLDDQVVCADGSVCVRNEAFADVRSGYHRTDEDRHGANVEIVTEVINGIGESADEYCTENTDYADGHAVIVDECSHRWADCVKEWIQHNHDYPDVTDQIVEHVCDNLDGSRDCEVKRNNSDYSGYSGPGCCLDGFKIDEHEESIYVDAIPELKALHDAGKLDDVLDDVSCDYYIRRRRRREKIDGCYGSVGRETYDPYGHEHPSFEIYSHISGGWDFVVPAERMCELFTAAIIELCRQVDGKD